jgi:hypothetical protein
MLVNAPAGRSGRPFWANDAKGTSQAARLPAASARAAPPARSFESGLTTDVDIRVGESPVQVEDERGHAQVMLEGARQ